MGLFLVFLSLFYGAVIRLRCFLYRVRILPHHTLPFPVISVGNLTVGGTGKTPAVLYLARRLEARGRKVAILSRGYGRISSESPGEVGHTDSGILFVSRGDGPLVGRREAGEEPYLLAENLPGVAVVVGKKRHDAGAAARRELGATVAILDDGYQHLSLARDLNILLIDGCTPIETEQLLPAGRLRESARALGRADLAILTHVDQAEDVKLVRNGIERIHSGIPVLEACHQPLYLENMISKQRKELSWLEGRKILSLASLARPVAFHRTLGDLGAELVESRNYPDHHWYERKDWIEIEERAKKAGACAVITTEKDAVSLRESLREVGGEKPGMLPAPEIECYFLKVEFKMTQGEEILDRFLEKILGGGGLD